MTTLKQQSPPKTDQMEHFRGDPWGVRLVALFIVQFPNIAKQVTVGVVSVAGVLVVLVRSGLLK